MPDLVAALVIVSVLVSLLRLLSQTGFRRPPEQPRSAAATTSLRLPITAAGEVHESSRAVRFEF